MKLGGLPGAGKVHLKCSNKKLVKANFANQRQIRFDTLSCAKCVGMADQSKHSWREAELTRVKITQFNVRQLLAKHQKPFPSVFSLGKETSWAFTAELVIYLYKKFVPVVVIQHGRILKNARACIMKNLRPCNHGRPQKFFQGVGQRPHFAYTSYAQPATCIRPSRMFCAA